MSSCRFVPNGAGLNELRNLGSVQEACLSIAQGVASSATASCGFAFTCDVQPGKTRCHARASCQVPVESSRDYYKGNFNVGNAAASAARAFGGSASAIRRSK